LYEGAAIFKTPNGQVHSVRQGQAIAIGDAETKYAVTGNPPKSAEILASAKEKMGEVEKKTPAHPFEDKPLPAKEEKKGDASGISASAYEYQGPVVTTLAGSGKKGFADGNGAEASFTCPAFIALDKSGNIYLSDVFNNSIRKITPAGAVSTFAGSEKNGFEDGTGVEASLSRPNGIAIDQKGYIYFAEEGGNRIRKITPEGVVTTLAGSGIAGFAEGTGVEASFNAPSGVAVDSSGNVYVSDNGNCRIRKITPSGNVSTLAGSGTAGFADGQGIVASFSGPTGIALDSNENIYVSDGGNNRIRKISPSGIVTTLAGSGKLGSLDGTGPKASFDSPSGVAIDGLGNVYVSDANNRIRKITPKGNVTTLAGSGKADSEDGYGSNASFNRPWGLAVDGSGSVYVCELSGCKIRKIYQY
jgi:sugar lactone lactonase YvrE